MEKLEWKFRTFLAIGNVLGDAVVLVPMVKPYVNKEYTEVTIGPIAAALSQ